MLKSNIFYTPKCGFFLFILAIAVSFMPVFAQEIITADRYMEMVSNRYAGIRDYEASIAIRSGNTEMAGNVSHKAPSLLRVDFTRPADQVILFNGEMLTIHLPDFRAVLNQPLNANRAGAASMATSQGLSMLRRNYVPSFVTSPTPVPLYDGSQERVVKIRLTRRSISEGFREIILSVNPETLLIRRIEGRTISETEVRFDFSNIRVNQGIPEHRFIYNPPGTASVFNNFLFRE